MNRNNSATLSDRRTFMHQMAGLAALPFIKNVQNKSSRVYVIRGIYDNPPAVNAQLTTRALEQVIPEFTSGVNWEDPRLSLVMKTDCCAPLALPTRHILAGLLEHTYKKGLQPWNVTVFDTDQYALKRIAPVLTSKYGDVNTLTLRDASTAAKEGAARKRLNELLQKEGSYHIHFGPAMGHALLGFSGALVQGALELMGNLRTTLASEILLKRRLINAWKHKLMPRHLFSVVDLRQMIFLDGPAAISNRLFKEESLIIGSDPVAVDITAHGLLSRFLKQYSITPPDTGLLEAAAEAGIGSLTPAVQRLDISR